MSLAIPQIKRANKNRAIKMTDAKKQLLEEYKVLSDDYSLRRQSYMRFKTVINSLIDSVFEDGERASLAVWDTMSVLGARAVDMNINQLQNHPPWIRNPEDEGNAITKNKDILVSCLYRIEEDRSVLAKMHTEAVALLERLDVRSAEEYKFELEHMFGQHRGAEY